MSLQPRKRVKPFGLPRTPFNPQTGTFLPLGDGLFREMTVLEVGHDALLCSDRDGRSAIVLKPWALRKSTFDGKTFEGAVYASTGLDVRTVTPDGGSAAEEHLLPAYFVGEKVSVYYRGDEVRGGFGVGSVGASELENVPAGDHRLAWEDLNTAGRSWQAPSSGVVIATLVSDEGGGLYTWTLFKGDGPASGEARELQDTTGLTGVVVLYFVEDEYWFLAAGAASDDVIGAKVHKGVTQTITTNTFTEIVFGASDVEDFDTNDFHDPAVNNKRLTVHNPGLYQVTAAAIWAPNSSGIRRLFVDHYNGSGTLLDFLDNTLPANGGSNGTINQVLGNFNMAEDDYVLMEVWHDVGGNLDIAADRRAYLSLVRVGSLP